jgi:hypothetical protein
VHPQPSGPTPPDNRHLIRQCLTSRSAEQRASSTSLRDGFATLDTSDGQPMIAAYEEAGGVPLFRAELTTILTTTMTTFRPLDTLNYTTVESTSCLVTPSARGYGSEGLGVRIPSGALTTSENRSPSYQAPAELSRIVTTRAKLCAPSASALGCECT